MVVLTVCVFFFFILLQMRVLINVSDYLLSRQCLCPLSIESKFCLCSVRCVGRYRPLASKLKNFRGSIRQGCELILQEVVPAFASSVSFGEAMMFLKRLEPLNTLNERREIFIEASAVRIARVCFKVCMEAVVLVVYASSLLKHSLRLMWSTQLPFILVPQLIH